MGGKREESRVTPEFSVWAVGRTELLFIEMRKVVEGAVLEGKTKGSVIDKIRGRHEACIQGKRSGWKYTSGEHQCIAGI